MKALTIKQPWAWAIIYGGKDIENRTWPTRYRGPLAIHAGKEYDMAGFDKVLKVPGDHVFTRGAMIGTVTLVDCVLSHWSEWAQPDCWHWVLRDPLPCTPVPCQGKLGLWNWREFGSLDPIEVRNP